MPPAVFTNVQFFILTSQMPNEDSPEPQLDAMRKSPSGEIQKSKLWESDKKFSRQDAQHNFLALEYLNTCFNYD